MFMMRSRDSTHRFAKSLRKRMSPPEVLLWERLRGLRGDGPTFRRQHPIGPYVADFCCSKARLVVEVDGAQHNHEPRIARDEERDRYMRDRGYRIYRIPAVEIMRRADDMAQGVVEAALALLLPREAGEVDRRRGR